MKNSNFLIGLIAAGFALSANISAEANDLVILQTNDTHSQIDPTDKGFGGVQRRKVFVDSVRAAQPNVLLIDSGDAVQGTLFFTLYGGEVEMKVMNNLGYDVQILGNHDFDNGVEKMARNVGMSNAQWLATNYKFESPDVAGLFKPYKIFTFGDKRVGVIGLNLDPNGMIAADKSAGVTYLDAVEAANAAAWWLKNQEGVDLVVAVSHLGYENVPSPTDQDIVKNTKNIDMIFGGHSHTLLSPGSGREWLTNADGKPVLVTQNAKMGEYITEVTVDLDKLGEKLPAYRQVRLGAAYDRSTSDELASLILPYRHGVDSLMTQPIGKTARELPNSEPALLNFVSDFVFDRGSELLGRQVDLSLMNVGSLRRGLPKGGISEGMIISMQPFDNRILVMELSGQDLIDAMKVYASRGGDGVSANVAATYNNKDHTLASVTVSGKEIDPAKTYTVATIDYLAGGGDYMKSLKNGRIVAQSQKIVYYDLINYIKKNYSRKKINPSNTLRFAPAAN